MKALPLFASLAFVLLFAGCETTTVTREHHGYHSGGYYNDSPRYVSYNEVRYHDRDYDHSHRDYDRNVARTNVYERNVSRTNVNVVNVNRRTVAQSPTHQTVAYSNRNAHVATATTQAQVHGKKVKKGHQDNDQDNKHD